MENTIPLVVHNIWLGCDCLEDKSELTALIHEEHTELKIIRYETVAFQFKDLPSSLSALRQEAL